MSKKLGSKGLEKFSLNSRHMITFLEPLVLLIPKLPFPSVPKFGVWIPLRRCVVSGLGLPHFVNRNLSTEDLYPSLLRANCGPDQRALSRSWSSPCDLG